MANKTQTTQTQQSCPSSVEIVSVTTAFIVEVYKTTITKALFPFNIVKVIEVQINGNTTKTGALEVLWDSNIGFSIQHTYV